MFYRYLLAGAVAAYALYQSFFAGDDRDHRSQSHHSDSEPSQPPVPQRDGRQYRVNIDSSKSQHDYTPVETYASLRARAKQEADLMRKCLRQSQQAYERRDHPGAKRLSDEGKRHRLKMGELDAKASTIIFKENNQDRDVSEVDLHGLYVKEAIAYSKRALAKARQSGYSEIRLIVGQGTHSDGGVARLKPAIQEAMEMLGLHVEVDPRNPGVLLVRG